VTPDERVPVLFRDIGPQATARFLAGDLRRLAGPLTPITYMRSHRYVEPYTDHGRIGRLVILDPRVLKIWHSGQPDVYVAEAHLWSDAVGYVPGHWSLKDAADRLDGVRVIDEMREALGGAEHDDAIEDAQRRLYGLNATLAESERRAEPLRRRLQSKTPEIRAAAREEMEMKGITELDLCQAWHHLPAARRTHLLAVL
jgi:hypothetical protein